MTRFLPIRPALLALVGGVLLSAPAAAQLISKDAWQAPPHNRASIAFSMKAITDGASGSASGAQGVTQFLCGGGSTSATANNTCIILNNSNGEILTDQDSDGSQTATNETTLSNMPGPDTTEADAIMDTLGIQ